MKDPKPTVRLADPESIELTLTITMPVHAWRRVMQGNNWNPFRDTVGAALARVNALSDEKEPRS